MKFTFLGTGTSQGIPVIACPCEVCHSQDPHDNRLRSSGMLQVEGKTLVFDTGPDFRFQMLRWKVKDLDAVIFTHPHKDHTAGLDDVRPFNFLLNKAIHVYANSLTIHSLKGEFPYIFAQDKYPGAPEIEVHEIIGEQPFNASGILLTPIAVLHGKMTVLGYRYQNFAYITDANFISEESLVKLKGLDTLVINALRITPHHSHFSLAEAIEMVNIIQPKQAYLTHISHLLGKHAQISAQLPENIFLAYDGLQIPIL